LSFLVSFRTEVRQFLSPDHAFRLHGSLSVVSIELRGRNPSSRSLPCASFRIQALPFIFMVRFQQSLLLIQGRNPSSSDSEPKLVILHRSFRALPFGFRHALSLHGSLSSAFDSDSWPKPVLLDSEPELVIFEFCRALPLQILGNASTRRGSLSELSAFFRAETLNRLRAGARRPQSLLCASVQIQGGPFFLLACF
jgi:hypothetical protein